MKFFFVIPFYTSNKSYLGNIKFNIKIIHMLYNYRILYDLRISFIWFTNANGTKQTSLVSTFQFRPFIIKPMPFINATCREEGQFNLSPSNMVHISAVVYIELFIRISSGYVAWPDSLVSTKKISF